MSFAAWKKRSKRYHDMMAGHGIGRADAEEVALAAYKAGQRDGQKRLDAGAMRLRKGLQAAHDIFVKDGHYGYARACETFLTQDGDGLRAEKSTRRTLTSE